jgi:glutathione synthase/RimK-type ligase-like ATP-grasp enzyme
LIRGRAHIGDYLGPDTLLRLETAADNWETFKLLLKCGIEPAEREGYRVLDERAIDRLEYDRGWLIRPRQAYLGYARFLNSLGKEMTAGGQALQSTDEIALCFDKPRCQQRLAQAGLAVPRSFGSPRSYAELRDLVRCEGRLMIKLAQGSGAAGCVAIHRSPGRVRGITTVAEVVVRGESRLYHSKRVRHLHDETEVARLVDRLCIEGVQVESWLPKARWQGHNIDLRVVIIGGEPRHTVVRASRSIFTNLTLGNQRADVTAVVQRIGPAAWQRLRETCARVARVFPRSFTLGIDILVRPDWQRHDVLEVNAFGDLVLNELDRGEDTYAATLHAWQRRQQTVSAEVQTK